MTFPDQASRYTARLTGCSEQEKGNKWLEAAGATGVDTSRGTHFSLPDHGLQASIDGAVVVLGWRALAAPDIEAGRVVAPFDLVLPLGSSFYLAYPEAHSPRPNIAAFREWLIQEVESTSVVPKT